jgi:mRNA-degrading endonuclease RelE of RelBE toxin-antitoxin system
MRRNPFEGDVAQLKSQPANFRRRIGVFRIFFGLDPDARQIGILAIVRRRSTTYRRR